MRAGFALCDTIGGLTAALAVSSALYQRTHTGTGQFVDVAMLDAALAFLPGPVAEWTVAGIEQRQIGNGSVSRKPTANRFRAKDSFLVLVDLPGVDEQVVDIQVERNVLRIFATATAPAIGGLKLVYQEFEPTQYERQFTLSDEVDSNKIEATVRNGVLQIRLAKAERARPRKINVMAG